MCDVLGLSRSTFYYHPIEKVVENELDQAIQTIFSKSRNNYGTRKIKVELKKQGYSVSRRRIGRIMNELGLVSNYTVAQFKPFKSKVNEEPVKNELDRQYDDQEEGAVIVSDLTYVRVNGQWNYICLFIDLFNREIIGQSVGAHKTAELVYEALSSINRDLRSIGLFHTDRGTEFKNKVMDDALKTFGIKRSLSMKGCPYDNAVAEATFKVIKTEFIYQNHFTSINQLALELSDYINWFNRFRIHGTLGYKSPLDFKAKAI